MIIQHRRRPQKQWWSSKNTALLIFKACRLGHPHFEIIFIDLFSSNLIKTAFIAKKCI